MSAQLSRSVAVYSRHFVASRINARPRRRRRRRRVYFGPFRNNADNNGVDRIVTRRQIFTACTRHGRDTRLTSCLSARHARFTVNGGTLH